ncbi:essential MCU regulator, mitochondrial [Sitophilus oryzae]|uniref:Essential MCU regulator, mitochondrial n=1 Tax=Sitophilus oryzae TaxID=7048 RepID=A0A6J2YAB2_SITOR|nr:essential MCU regulator, mitochondrial [Sitophilus oryzae]
MSLSLLSIRSRQSRLLKISKNIITQNRLASATKRGVILPPPERTSFGLFKVALTVMVGLFIGAGISKNIANFLEENDLFVPEDDDDDD